MKKIFILTLFSFLFLAAKSQVYSGIGLGYSSKKSGIYELQIGYKLINTIFQVGYQAHIDNRNAAIFQCKVGYRIKFIELSGGYGYQLVSNDNKERNCSAIIGSLTYYRELGVGEMFISFTTTYNHNLATFGIRYFIN